MLLSSILRLCFMNYYDFNQAAFLVKDYQSFAKKSVIRLNQSR